MASIKININSRAMPKQTSTTFTETSARFFLQSWSLLNTPSLSSHWLIRDSNNINYQSRNTVTKSFQSAVNDMISMYDSIYGCKDDNIGRWNRDEIEYHLLTIMCSTARRNKINLKKLVSAEKTNN